jgi:hypothetical protein
MKTEPQQEHQWLQQLVGEWTYEAEATMEPGQPPSKFEGSESVRSLGGLDSGRGTGRDARLRCRDDSADARL